MGLLRFFLAVSVVVAHTYPIPGFRIINAVGAVQTFYIISGFYMTMILREKYRGPGSYRLFLTNRLLRLLPPYWCVLAVTWLVFTLVHRFTGTTIGWQEHYQRALSPLSWLFVTVANFAILGQDWLLFMGWSPGGHLHFVPGLHLMDEPAHRFLLNPPTWSLGVELTFYLVAPLLVRRPLKAVLGCIFASLALRVLLIFGLGFYRDPWHYRFFPTELALFLLGAVSYHVYERLRQSPDSDHLHRLALFGFAAATIAYEYLPDWNGGDRVSVRACVYYLAACLTIPLLFSRTKENRLDRYLGELSYPIYIVHFPVIWLLVWVRVHHPSPGITANRITWAAITFTVLGSCLLLHGVIDPVERLRQRRAARDSAPKPRPLRRAA